MVEQNDWRLTNQMDYLFAATLIQQRWQSSGAGEDHDHCIFCWTKFSNLGLPDEQATGFATEDGRYWVCAPCVEDFRERFQWSLR